MQYPIQALKIVFIFFIFNMLTTSSVAQDLDDPASLDTSEWNLMLVGGSMNTCSSMGSSNCENTDWIDSDSMRTHNPVQLTDSAILRIEEAEMWQEGRFEVRERLIAALRSLKTNFGEDKLHFGDFRDTMSSIYPNLWRELYDREYYLLRDSIQVPYSALPPEAINFPLTSVQAGVGLFETFVERAKIIAGDRQPNILVVTASARDSFDAVDFYMQAFEHFGADVAWFPVDAGLGHAISSNDCENIDNFRANAQNSFYQSRKHETLSVRQSEACNNPQQLVDLMSRADGIFFNGGDQSLTRQAFVTPEGEPFPWLEVLQQRVHEELMIAGGTSAGTAVMSAPLMISNGSGQAALNFSAAAADFPPRIDCERKGTCQFDGRSDQLTYHPNGGLSLFPFGVMDTHFSERGRQARLTRLLADTNATLGVGVDETTALLINTKTGAFQVQGAHGVFMLEHATMATTNNPNLNAMTAKFHYFRNGSKGMMTEQGVTRVQFNPIPQPDTGDTPNNELLRDRTITAALNQCEQDVPETLRQNDVSVRLLFASALLQHSESACEIYNGDIAFVWSKIQ